jgi:hypothetical protein
LVAQLPRGVERTIGIEPSHHDAPSGHGHSVTPRRERPHTRTPRATSQSPLRDPVHPLISPHSWGSRFDVTRESHRLYEFLLSTRRFPA